MPSRGGSLPAAGRNTRILILCLRIIIHHKRHPFITRTTSNMKWFAAGTKKMTFSIFIKLIKVQCTGSGSHPGTDPMCVCLAPITESPNRRTAEARILPNRRIAINPGPGPTGRRCDTAAAPRRRRRERPGTAAPADPISGGWLRGAGFRVGPTFTDRLFPPGCIICALSSGGDDVWKHPQASRGAPRPRSPTGPGRRPRLLQRRSLLLQLRAAEEAMQRAISSPL